MDLDIFALLLWMVYGGFIIIVFILMFNWVENNYYLFYSHFNKIEISILFVIAWISLMICNLVFAEDVNWHIVWHVMWVNYYEILISDLEEELEVLGWGIGVDNVLAVILISILLTLVCICAVIILNIAYNYKLINFEMHYYNSFYTKSVYKFIFLKSQNFHIQERRVRLNNYSHYKLFHYRRM